MKKIVRLTENDLTKLVKRVINERANEKYWEEFKDWVKATDQVKIWIDYDKEGKRVERAKKYGQLPKLYFNDGSSLSVQISEHNGWEGISVRDTKYGTEEEEEELSDNEEQYEGDGNGLYSNVPGGAIARIIKKRGGIDTHKSLSGDKVEPGEAPPLSERYLAKTIKRIIKNNYY